MLDIIGELCDAQDIWEVDCTHFFSAWFIISYHYASVCNANNNGCSVF